MTAQVRQLEAVLDAAHLQLEYASLRAPFAGAVAQRHLDEGATVTNTTAVLTIVQEDPIFVVVDCPERDLPALPAARAATIASMALTPTPLTALRPKRILPPTTVKPTSLSLTSGGRTLMPMAWHSLMYLTTWGVAPRSASEVSRAAMKWAG